MHIEHIAIKDLKAYERNSRTHDKSQIDKAAAHIDSILDKHHGLLRQSVVKCMAKVNQEPSAANLRDLKEAKKQLEEYNRQHPPVESDPAHFKSAVDAARWISQQGYIGKQGVISERQARKEVGKLRKDPRHGYPFAVVKKLADKTWGGKAEDIVADTPETVPGLGLLDGKERLIQAQSALQEMKLKEMQGRLIDAAEAERKEVQIIMGLRRHLETAIPERLIAFMANVKKNFSEEQQGIINSCLPELIEADREAVADIFDQLAQAGGVEI